MIKHLWADSSKQTSLAKNTQPFSSTTKTEITCTVFSFTTFRFWLEIFTPSLSSLEQQQKLLIKKSS